jgi:hypothetical protein
VFIPSFHNYRIWSFLGLLMTTYTAWYLTIAAIAHGQVYTLSVQCGRSIDRCSPFANSLSMDHKLHVH